MLVRITPKSVSGRYRNGCPDDPEIRNTLFRWNKALSPCRHRQKPATKIDMDALKADIQDWPDDYQWERVKRLGLSQSCIYYALDSVVRR